MTCASRSEQRGQRGSERGSARSASACPPRSPGRWRAASEGTLRSVFLRLANCKLLFLEASQHRERALVDGAGPAPPAQRVPAFPIDAERRRVGLELLLQAGSQLWRAHAQPALAVKYRGLAVRRPEPLDCLLPGKVKRRGVDA